MRIAAGIILIIFGISGLIGLVNRLSYSGIYLPLLPIILWRIGSVALLVTGGVFCLKRRYWGPCLASALLALFIGISSAIDNLRYILTNRVEPLLVGPISMTWGTWILALGAVISTIFISLTKKEWQKS